MKKPQETCKDLLPNAAVSHQIFGYRSLAVVGIVLHKKQPSALPVAVFVVALKEAVSGTGRIPLLYNIYNLIIISAISRLNRKAEIEISTLKYCGLTCLPVP